jgi:hypothetical protein
VSGRKGNVRFDALQSRSGPLHPTQPSREFASVGVH